MTSSPANGKSFDRLASRIPQPATDPPLPYGRSRACERLGPSIREVQYLRYGTWARQQGLACTDKDERRDAFGPGSDELS